MPAALLPVLATAVDVLDVGRWPTVDLADVLLITGRAAPALAPEQRSPGAVPASASAVR